MSLSPRRCSRSNGRKPTTRKDHANSLTQLRHLAGEATTACAGFHMALMWEIVWHVPAVLTTAMHSNTWHLIQHASFLVSGLLFWWPVVQPWPSAHTEPQWSIVLYLFLATLPCDVLAAFLVFSERLVYPVYLVGSGRSEASVLADQVYAGALMWTCVTIIYLVAGTTISIRLLAWPRSLRTSYPTVWHSRARE